MVVPVQYGIGMSEPGGDQLAVNLSEQLRDSGRQITVGRAGRIVVKVIDDNSAGHCTGGVGQSTGAGARDQNESIGGIASRLGRDVIVDDLSHTTSFEMAVQDNDVHVAAFGWRESNKLRQLFFIGFVFVGRDDIGGGVCPAGPHAEMDFDDPQLIRPALSGADQHDTGACPE